MTVSIRCTCCSREWDRVPQEKVEEALAEAATFGWQLEPLVCAHCVEEPVIEQLPLPTQEQ